MMASVFSILALRVLIAATAVHPNSTSLQRVEPKDYAVKRFEEVWQDAATEDARSDGEKLIELRARLALAERELDRLKNNVPPPATANADGEGGAPANPNPQAPLPPRSALLRAYTARVDHYRKLVDRLEVAVVTQKKAGAAKAAAKKKR